MTTKNNAGLCLWDAQKGQGTGFCSGLDLHYTKYGALDEGLYGQWAGGELYRAFLTLAVEYSKMVDTVPNPSRAAIFISGVTQYFLRVIDVTWSCGVRVFKPQSAFYEQLGPFAGVVLRIVCKRIDELARKYDVPVFKILDAKRGDIADTQAPYFRAYLSGTDEEVVPGVNGYGFDAMTVTTWMGEDVLTPGLPFFRNGKGAIVVTRSSNPSGTTLQDLLAAANRDVVLSGKQQPFSLGKETIGEVRALLGRQPSVHELMLYKTSQFSADNGLDQDGVSPVFSVMGSTVEMDEAFRKLRPGGIGLIPGLGAQEGQFKNFMPLGLKEGPLAGHVGILSSSRAHNFPWMKKYGGNDDPKDFSGQMERAIDSFRKYEKQAYQEADLMYPF